MHFGGFRWFLDVFGMILMGETNIRASHGGYNFFVIADWLQPNKVLSGGQGLRK